MLKVHVRIASMLKRFIVLVVLSLTLSLPSLAEASGSLTFNSKTFETGLAVGSQIDTDYYIVSVLDGDFESGASKFISATLFIPTELFVDGTYDLEVLKPSKQSSSANSCSDSEDENKKFKLPRNDRVYIILSDVSLKSTDTAITTKGVVSTDEVETGTVTIENITEGAFGLSADASFEITAKISTYSAVVPLNLSCEDTLKKTKVKYSKNAGTSEASGDFTEALIFSSTADSGDFNFKRLPNNQLIPVK